MRFRVKLDSPTASTVALQQVIEKFTFKGAPAGSCCVLDNSIRAVFTLREHDGSDLRLAVSAAIAERLPDDLVQIGVEPVEECSSNQSRVRTGPPVVTCEMVYDHPDMLSIIEG